MQPKLLSCVLVLFISFLFFFVGFPILLVDDSVYACVLIVFAQAFAAVCSSLLFLFWPALKLLDCSFPVSLSLSLLLDPFFSVVRVSANSKKKDNKPQPCVSSICPAHTACACASNKENQNNHNHKRKER